MNTKLIKRKDRLRNQSQSVMSSKTKEFLQKICYKKTASVDMTQYGFVRNSVMMRNPVALEMENLHDSKSPALKPRKKTVKRKKANKGQEYFKVQAKGNRQNKTN